MDGMEFFGVFVVPVIIGVVEVAKGTGLSARWAAPMALALGVGLSLAATDSSVTLAGAVVRGLALGLSASGLYSAVDVQLGGSRRRSAAIGHTVAAEGRSTRGDG